MAACRVLCRMYKGALRSVLEMKLRLWKVMERPPKEINAAVRAVMAGVMPCVCALRLPRPVAISIRLIITPVWWVSFRSGMAISTNTPTRSNRAEITENSTIKPPIINRVSAAFFTALPSVCPKESLVLCALSKNNIELC